MTEPNMPQIITKCRHFTLQTHSNNMQYAYEDAPQNYLIHALPFWITNVWTQQLIYDFEISCIPISRFNCNVHQGLGYVIQREIIVVLTLQKLTTPHFQRCHCAISG